MLVFYLPTSLQKSASGGCISYFSNATGQSRLRNFKIVSPPVAPSSIVFQRLSSCVLVHSLHYSILLYLFRLPQTLNCSYVALVSLPCYLSPWIEAQNTLQPGTNPSWQRGPSSLQASPAPYDPLLSPFSPDQLLILVTTVFIRQRWCSSAASCWPERSPKARLCPHWANGSIRWRYVYKCRLSCILLIGALFV